MNRSLLAGLSGTLTNQMYIDVVANNIANANTVGFREGRVTFQDAFYQTLSGGRAGSQAGLGGVNPAQIGSGAAMGQIQTIHTQGSMRYSGFPLDAALEGQGMFVLGTAAGGELYTRDGSFALDDSRTLVCGSNGMPVLGWMAQNGEVNAVGEPAAMTFPIGQVRPGRATTTAAVTGNLDAGLATGGVSTASIAVYDSLGLPHEVNLTFTRSATANEWSVTATAGASSATGTVTFDGDDGSVASGGSLTLNMALSSGATTPQAVQVDLSGVTQLAQPGSDVRVASQDGTPSSTLSAVSILDGGNVQGEFSDGHVETLGCLAVAAFGNVGGLMRVGNNLYQMGANTGQIDLGPAGVSGRGEIRARQLEMSNVDLTRSFVEVMTAQRGFQASTRVISAANRLLDDVMQLNVG